jgi:hypothetical protein
MPSADRAGRIREAQGGGRWRTRPVRRCGKALDRKVAGGIALGGPDRVGDEFLQRLRWLAGVEAGGLEDLFVPEQSERADRGGQRIVRAVAFHELDEWKEVAIDRGGIKGVDWQFLEQATASGSSDAYCVTERRTLLR